MVAFMAGEKVVVTCSDEGYDGKCGEIVNVFPSGRCQVAIGRPVVLLNLPPEGIKRVENDQQV